MKPTSVSFPSFIEAMQALLVEKLPEGDWLYEVKLDGYRALAFKDGKEVRLISRNNKQFNFRLLGFGNLRGSGLRAPMLVELEYPSEQPTIDF